MSALPRLLSAAAVCLLLLSAAYVWRDVALRPLNAVGSVAEGNDPLHFGAHLVAARVFSLCPCTGAQSEEHYRRAVLHAGSGRQLALVTTERPVGAGARLTDGVRLARLPLEEAASAANARPIAGMSAVAVGALLLAVWHRRESRARLARAPQSLGLDVEMVGPGPGG